MFLIGSTLLLERGGSKDGFREVVLTKAGLLDKRHQKGLQLASAWAELIGYFGSITLKGLQIQAMFAKESKLRIALAKREDGTIISDDPRGIEKMVSQIQQKRTLKILSLIQDLSDTFLALSDIRDGKGALSNPLLLSCCGLLSALISTHKNWVAC